MIETNFLPLGCYFVVTGLFHLYFFALHNIDALL